MADFKLKWDVTDLIGNANALYQTAYYRPRSNGSQPWLSTGFFPSNPLPVSVNETTISSLLSNIVYQFKVESSCADGGPMINDNGVIEKIEFSCITPNITVTETTANVTIDLNGTDITKVRLFLKDSITGELIIPSEIVYPFSSIVSKEYVGLTPGKNYFIQTELIATVNNVDVTSQLCSPYSFTTIALPVCNSPISVTVESIEIL